jgi:DNA-binding CsgD family transcriptional regulator
MGEPIDKVTLASDDCAALMALFQSDPGVGFAILDLDARVLFVNRRAAELFGGSTPEADTGRLLSELYGAEWAAERIEILKRIDETGQPTIIRHIRRGRQMQSTIRPLHQEDGMSPAFSVVTVLGEHDPPEGAEVEIIESAIADLGPLSALTRRELEVLALIGHGMSAPEIAQTLFRSPKTIERHTESLRTKLRAANRVALAHFAHRAGLRLSDAALRRTEDGDV